ncbi:MAG: GIY-YIG nuclease family protein [Nanoarchaeota archaeon]|nr:GIY-YIG nuclease family protein [Nanoarchaeota archaeon]
MKGIYLLVVKVKKRIKIKIGALGKINFDKGDYIYIGSAQNNLEKRIERHLRSKKKRHWHIDYLLEDKSVKVIEVFYQKSKKSEECETANRLLKTETPILNFGCSDCKCKSHLFKIKNLKNIFATRHTPKLQNVWVKLKFNLFVK